MFELHEVDRGRRLIEDVLPPETWNNFDVRDTSVRQKSIGYLDSQYLRKINSGHIQVAATESREPIHVNVRRRLTYTRVPPLSTWSLTASGPKLAGAGAVVSGLPWLPKKYTLQKGLSTDWHTKTFKHVKWSAPAIAVLGTLMVGTMLWQLPTPKAGHKKSPPSHKSLITNVSQVNPSTPAGSTGGSGSNGPANSGPASLSPSLAQSPNSSKPPLAPSTVPANSVAMPTPITIPAGGLGGGSANPVPVTDTSVPPVQAPLPDPTAISVPSPGQTLAPIVNQPLVNQTTQVVPSVPSV